MVMIHYIHRPTPEGGETDDRFRDVNALSFICIESWSTAMGWRRMNPHALLVRTGTIWRIPGSDAPSAETLRLAMETR